MRDQTTITVVPLSPEVQEAAAEAQAWIDTLPQEALDELRRIERAMFFGFGAPAA